MSMEDTNSQTTHASSQVMNQGDEDDIKNSVVALADGSGMLFISSSAHPPQLVIAHRDKDDDDGSSTQSHTWVELHDEEVGTSPKDHEDALVVDCKDEIECEKDDEDSSVLYFEPVNLSNHSMSKEDNEDREKEEAAQDLEVQSSIEQESNVSALSTSEQPHTHERLLTQDQQQQSSCSSHKKDGFRIVNLALAVVIGMLLSWIIFFVVQFASANDASNDYHSCVIGVRGEDNSSLVPAPAYLANKTLSLGEYSVLFDTSISSIEDSSDYTQTAERLVNAFVDSTIKEYFLSMDDDRAVFVSSKTDISGDYKSVIPQEGSTSSNGGYLRLMIPFRTTVNLFEEATVNTIISSGPNEASFPLDLKRLLPTLWKSDSEAFRTFLLSSAPILAAQDNPSFYHFLLYTNF